VFLMSEKLYLEENMAPKYLEALKEYLTKLLELLYTDDSEQIIFKKLNKKEDISRRVNSFIQVELQMAKIINETDKHYVNFYFFICKGSCQRKKFVAYWRGCGVYLCTKAKIFN